MEVYILSKLHEREIWKPDVIQVLGIEWHKMQNFWIGAVERVKIIKGKSTSTITSFRGLPGMSTRSQKGKATTWVKLDSHVSLSEDNWNESQNVTSIRLCWLFSESIRRKKSGGPWHGRGEKGEENAGYPAIPFGNTWPRWRRSERYTSKLVIEKCTRSVWMHRQYTRCLACEVTTCFAEP